MRRDLLLYGEAARLFERRLVRARHAAPSAAAAAAALLTFLAEDADNGGAAATAAVAAMPFLGAEQARAPSSRMRRSARCFSVHAQTLSMRGVLIRTNYKYLVRSPQKALHVMKPWQNKVRHPIQSADVPVVCLHHDS